MSIEVPRERSKATDWESGENAGHRSLTFDVGGVAAEAGAHKSAADATSNSASSLLSAIKNNNDNSVLPS
jgi:hypothetical protein